MCSGSGLPAGMGRGPARKFRRTSSAVPGRACVIATHSLKPPPASSECISPQWAPMFRPKRAASPFAFMHATPCLPSGPDRCAAAPARNMRQRRNVEATRLLVRKVEVHVQSFSGRQGARTGSPARQADREFGALWAEGREHRSSLRVQRDDRQPASNPTAPQAAREGEPGGACADDKDVLPMHLPLPA